MHKSENKYCKSCNIWKLDEDNIDVSPIIPLGGYETIGISEKNIQGEKIRFLYVKYSSFLMKEVTKLYSKEEVHELMIHNAKLLIGNVPLGMCSVIDITATYQQEFIDCSLNPLFEKIKSSEYKL